MTAHHVQALLSQQLAASASARRRFVPPSIPEPVSQSLNQRWRERPRRLALPVAPERRDGVVHAIVGRAACCRPACPVRAERRAAHVNMFVSGFARMRRSVIRPEIGSRAPQCFPEERRIHGVRYVAPHHRAFDAGAVLSVVNALRFASTRPRAGPSGIDDASARHVSGSYAMVVSVMTTRTKTTRTKLTRESSGSMLASSRQCLMALPPFAPRANGARIRPAPIGHDIERIPHFAAVVTCKYVSCKHRDLSQCIVLRTMRHREAAFTRGRPTPWPV